MVWVLVVIAALIVAAIAIVAVGRVTADLEHTVAPALLEIDDAVEAVAEALPFEVSAVLSHEDVAQIIGWVLDWFDEIGLASDFGEELGGEWVDSDRVVVDEVRGSEQVVARAIAEQPGLDPLHVTVVVDELFTWLRDIGAIGGEVH